MPGLDPNYSYQKLEKYPHMFPLDIAIWERFISDYPDFFNHVDYDVKVGSGSQVNSVLSKNYQHMQEILSKYRIDVVGYTTEEIYIIEVKPEAGTIAIGQVITYRTLYQRDFLPQNKVRGMIVSDRLLPDMTQVAGENDIIIKIV